MAFLDSEHVKHLLPNTLLGAAASIIRAVNGKEPFARFAARFVSGTLMAGTVAWLTFGMGLPPFISGILSFASGYASQEMAARITKGGQKAADDLFNSKKEKDDDGADDLPNQ